MATLQTTSERLRQQANGSNSPSDGLRLSRSGLWAVRLGRALLWAVRLGRLGSAGLVGFFGGTTLRPGGGARAGLARPWTSTAGDEGFQVASATTSLSRLNHKRTCTGASLMSHDSSICL